MMSSLLSQLTEQLTQPQSPGWLETLELLRFWMVDRFIVDRFMLGLLIDFLRISSDSIEACGSFSHFEPLPFEAWTSARQDFLGNFVTRRLFESQSATTDAGTFESGKYWKLWSKSTTDWDGNSHKGSDRNCTWFGQRAKGSEKYLRFRKK